MSNSPGRERRSRDHEMLKREEGVRSDRSRKWVKAQGGPEYAKTHPDLLRADGREVFSI